MNSRRAVEIGAVDCAAIKTPGGKVRLRLLFTIEQLEALLVAAKGDDADDETHMKRNETHGNARTESEQNREDSGGGDARARPPPAPPATIEQNVFVIEGTRAWDAWKAYKTREKGMEWSLSTHRVHEGKRQNGWYFPTLFPPSTTTTTEGR